MKFWTWRINPINSHSYKYKRRAAFQIYLGKYTSSDRCYECITHAPSNMEIRNKYGSSRIT